MRSKTVPFIRPGNSGGRTGFETEIEQPTRSASIDGKSRPASDSASRAAATTAELREFARARA
jgi:hypothetical protein